MCTIERANFVLNLVDLFVQLINQKCGGDAALVEMLVNGLLGRLVDTSHVVRKLCIRGLGNVASNGPEQVSAEVQMFLCGFPTSVVGRGWDTVKRKSSVAGASGAVGLNRTFVYGCGFDFGVCSSVLDGFADAYGRMK